MFRLFAAQLAQLHPLSIACVQLGDSFLCELIAEVAQSCIAMPLPAAHTTMLEGVKTEASCA